MKKKIVCVIALLMVLTGCGQGSEEPVAATPAATETPKETAVPEAAGTPVTTEAPRGTAVPEATGTPVTTEAPKGTAVPEATGMPAATGAPKGTAVPETTEPSPVPETPKPTGTPAVTETPVTTEVSGEDNSSDPIATEAPKLTETPEKETPEPAATEPAKSTEVPTATEAPAHVHSFVDRETPATCTEPQIITTVCSECGFEEGTRTGSAALGHDMNFYVYREPDCKTGSGYGYDLCSRCGYVDNHQYIPYEHDFEETMGYEGDCKTTPSYTLTCKKCGWVEKRDGDSVNMDNHLDIFEGTYEEADREANATITYYVRKCSACDTVFEEYEISREIW